MKIALMTAIREDIDLPYEGHFKRVMSNLAPMYLASYLESQSSEHQIEIRDHLKDFDDFQPDLVGISSTTENIEFAKWLAKKVKLKWNAITVLGGSHISALPQALPEEFDFAVLGEGEIIFAQLIDLLSCGKNQSEFLSQVNGLVYRDQGTLFRNAPAQVVKEIDQFPFPKREKYIETIGQLYVMTSRGCPYTCSFCTVPKLNGTYRMHSDDYVIHELESIRKYFPQVKSIRIFDDLFVVNQKRVKRLAERIDQEGIANELIFSCWGRANLINEDLIQSLKKMNTAYVAFGAESGSKSMINEVKPGSSVEANQKAIDLLYENGIAPSCSFLLGHPGETEADLRDTFKFIEKNKTKFFELELNVAIPWPGTLLWEQAKSKGLVHDFMNFDLIKEAAYFPNYSVDEYPYLNESLAPMRFMEILHEFRDLWFEVNHNEKNRALIAEMGLKAEQAKMKSHISS